MPSRRSRCARLPLCRACKLPCSQLTIPIVEFPINKDLLCVCEGCCSDWPINAEFEQDDSCDFVYEKPCQIQVQKFDEDSEEDENSFLNSVEIPSGYSTVHKFLKDSDNFFKYQNRDSIRRCAKRNISQCDTAETPEKVPETSTVTTENNSEKKPKVDFDLSLNEDVVEVRTIDNLKVNPENPLSWALDNRIFRCLIRLTKKDSVILGREPVVDFVAESPKVKKQTARSKQLKKIHDRKKLAMKQLKTSQRENDPKVSQKSQNNLGTKKRKRTSWESVDSNVAEVSDIKSDLEKSLSDGSKVTQKNKRPRLKPETVGVENRENEPPKVEPISTGKSLQAAENSRSKGQSSKNQSNDNKSTNKNAKEKSKGKSNSKRSAFHRKRNENQNDKNSRVVKDFRIEADDNTEVAYTIKSSMLRKKKHWFEPKSVPNLPILPEMEICKRFKISPFDLPISEIGYKEYVKPEIFEEKEVTLFSVLDSNQFRGESKDALCRRHGKNLKVKEKSIAEDNDFAELYGKFSSLEFDLI